MEELVVIWGAKIIIFEIFCKPVHLVFLKFYLMNDINKWVNIVFKNGVNDCNTMLSSLPKHQTSYLIENFQVEHL